MPIRTVTLIAAVSIVIGWLLAATLSPPVARLQSRPERQPLPAASDAPAPFTEQLNIRLRDLPEPPTTRRNPFAFGMRERREPARVVEAPAIEAEAPVVPAGRPSRFTYSLSGIGISGDGRSAVLTDGENVHVVRVNDRVGPYVVIEITTTSLTLASDTERHTLRLPH